MLNKIAFFLLCFIVWFAPIPLGANRPWAWGIVELLICINTLLICFSASFKTIYDCIKPIKFLISILVFVQLWVFMQWLGGLYPNLSPLTSIDSMQTEISLIKGLSYCLFIINLAFLTDCKQRVVQICWVIICTGLTQALYAIFLVYSNLDSSLLSLDISSKATGSFVYQNHLANYLILCLSISIGYLIASLEGMQATSTRQKFALIIEALLSTKWIMRISIVIMVVALIMTRSRMGNSAFFVSLLVTSLLSLIFIKRPPNTLKWLVLSLIALDIIIVGSYFGIDKVKERIEVTSFQSEVRDDVVRDSVPYIYDAWMKGSGAGSFYSTFLQYQSTTYTAFYDHAHNEYVQFIVEFGLLPSALLFLMMLKVLWNSLKILHKTQSKLSRGLAMGTFMACSCMLIHSIVDFVLQDVAIVVLFLTILCLLNFSCHFDSVRNKSKYS